MAQEDLVLEERLLHGFRRCFAEKIEFWKEVKAQCKAVRFPWWLKARN